MAGEIGSKIIGFAMEKAFEELSQSVLGDKPVDFASEVSVTLNVSMVLGAHEPKVQ